MNFACSCQQHNISLHQILVFVASEEIILTIEATGAMALYHPEFGEVSKKASDEYLDRIFVDMMWYKTFSVFLLLKHGINVLFQDIDLVWFQEPFTYFIEYIQKMKTNNVEIEAMFSDDGQRSIRYAPLYANSGFYFLKASKATEYFAWSIITAFDSVQLLGSHQNTFTWRLVEGLGIGIANSTILPIELFPTGYLYHHDEAYMSKFRNKLIKPYNFHMCWTLKKDDKLKNLKESKMWYLQDFCSTVETFIPSGEVYNKIKGSLDIDQSVDTIWNEVSSNCCVSVFGAL